MKTLTWSVLLSCVLLTLAFAVAGSSASARLDETSLLDLPTLEAYGGYLTEVLGYYSQGNLDDWIAVAGSTIRIQEVAAGQDPTKNRILETLRQELVGFAAFLDVIAPLSPSSYTEEAQAALRGEAGPRALQLLQASRPDQPATVLDFFTFFAAHETGFSLQPATPSLDLAPGSPTPAPAPTPGASSGDTSPPEGYTTVTGQPNPFDSTGTVAGTAAPTGAHAPLSGADLGPLAATGDRFTLDGVPVCTWLVQLIIDEGFVPGDNLYGPRNRDRYLIPDFLEHGFHVQLHHPTLGTRRLAGEAARIVLEQKGYLAWDAEAEAWLVTEAYVHFVRYGSPPPQPVCPDAAPTSSATADQAPVSAGPLQCLTVEIDKTFTDVKNVGKFPDRYDASRFSLKVRLVNLCPTPIQVEGTCHAHVYPGTDGWRDMHFNKTVGDRPVQPITTGVYDGKYGNAEVDCSGTVTLGGQSDSWSRSG